MGTDLNHCFIPLGRFSSNDESPQGTADSEVEINVVLTSREDTLVALKLATDLASNLGARINLLAAHVVPFAFPLTRPPVSIHFLRQQLLELACERVNEGGLKTVIHLCLCRDKRQVFVRFLKPKSLVIIGGREHWWPTEESRLAKMLRSQGHEVIVTHPR